MLLIGAAINRALLDLKLKAYCPYNHTHTVAQCAAKITDVILPMIEREDMDADEIMAEFFRLAEG
jgi:hypothetical protein